MRRILSFSRIFLFLDILGHGFPSDFVCACTAAGYTPARNNPHQSDKSAFEKTQRLNEHGLNGLNGFLLILCCHLVLDCIRIVFAPVRRG